MTTITAPPGAPTAAGPRSAGEMVPLADRVRYMQLVRVAGALLVLLDLLSPHMIAGQRATLAASTAGYLLVAAIGEVFWRARRHRGLAVFGVLLLTDGAFLAWATQLSGGMASDIRFLIPVYTLATTLLASYRTGLKSAMWSTLTLYAAYRAGSVGMIPGTDTLLPAEARSHLLVLVVLLWIVAFATAVFSSVNERELRRRRYDLQSLTALSRCLEQETKPPAVAAATLRALADGYQIRRGLVIGSTIRGLQVLAALPDEPDKGMANTAVDEAPLVTRCWVEQSPLLLRTLDPAQAGTLAELMPDASNVIVVPLHDEQRGLGLLVLERGPADRGKLDRRSLAMIEQVTAHASLALRRAWLLEELRRRAETDGLTGLPNRRTFDETLGREVSRSERSGSPLSLLLVDIDHFKLLNDTHGHQAGDEVLRVLGSLLRRQARPFDTPARYGGEEFAVVLPDCTEDDAAAVAERIRAGIAGSNTPVPVTVSVGVACQAGVGATASELVGAADAALYEAKRAGRNAVRVARGAESKVLEELRRG